MYVRLANNSPHHIQVVAQSQTGTGVYNIPPHWWIWSGFWTPYKKFLLAFNAATGEPLSCQIIYPQPNMVYRLFPQIPPVPGGNPAPVMTGEAWGGDHGGQGGGVQPNGGGAFTD